jgi:hypothetical protein
VVQILSEDHTGFGVWLGDPFHDKESEQFVARYIERAPLSLEKLSIQDDIAPTQPKTAQLTSLTRWSFWQNYQHIFQKPTNPSPGITDDIPVGAEANALNSFLLQRKRATTGESSVEVVGPPA